MGIREVVIPARYRLFIWIFAATFLGWAVPHIVYRLTQPKTITFTFTLNALGVASIMTAGLALLATAGSSTGFWISLAQWIALRRYISSAWKWMLSLVLVWTIGGIIGFVIIILASFIIPYSQFDETFTRSTMIRLIIVGLFTGLFVGILQQVFLQKRTGIRFWWAVAGLFGVFSGSLLEGANHAASVYYVTMDPIYSAILSGLVFAGVASLPALLLRPEPTAGDPRVEEAHEEPPLLPDPTLAK